MATRPRPRLGSLGIGRPHASSAPCWDWSATSFARQPLSGRGSLFKLMGACSVLFAAHAVVIGIQAKWVGRTYRDRTLHVQRSVP
jgi:hypothetical protein